MIKDEKKRKNLVDMFLRKLEKTETNNQILDVITPQPTFIGEQVIACMQERIIDQESVGDYHPTYHKITLYLTNRGFYVNFENYTSKVEINSNTLGELKQKVTSKKRENNIRMVTVYNEKKAASMRKLLQLI